MAPCTPETPTGALILAHGEASTGRGMLAPDRQLVLTHATDSLQLEYRSYESI